MNENETMETETVTEISEKMKAYALCVRNATDGCAPDVADNIATGIKDFACRLEAACKRCPDDTYLRMAGKMREINKELVNALKREVAELRERLRVSSNAMEIVVQWLGKHPKWQERLRDHVAENREVTGEIPDTAQDMFSRERFEEILSHHNETVAMLRQAADALERDE